MRGLLSFTSRGAREDFAQAQSVSKHTICTCRAKHCVMEVSEAEEAKHPRDESARLKKPVADLSLDKDMCLASTILSGR